MHLKDGVGESGDAHEQHADAVARAVVQGKSAGTLLDSYGGNAVTAGPTVAGSTGAPAPVEPKPWAPPGEQPIPFYIGNEAHAGIAASYAAAHGGEPVLTNTSPLKSILRALGPLLAAQGQKVDASALSDDELGLMPDITNLKRLHLYEIKPLAAETATRGVDLGGPGLGDDDPGCPGRWPCRGYRARRRKVAVGKLSNYATIIPAALASDRVHLVSVGIATYGFGHMSETKLNPQKVAPSPRPLKLYRHPDPDTLRGEEIPGRIFEFSKERGGWERRRPHAGSASMLMEITDVSVAAGTGWPGVDPVR